MIKRKCDTPISDRMKELRGGNLTAYQRTLVANFIERNVSRKDAWHFAKAFDICLEIDVTKEKLRTETDEKERVRYNAELRGLKNKITPTAKRAAIERNRPLVAAALQDFRRHGAPTKIALVIERLRRQGFRIAPDNAARDALAMTARKVRAILQKKFGIEGKRGRKARRS